MSIRDPRIEEVVVVRTLRRAEVNKVAMDRNCRDFNLLDIAEVQQAPQYYIRGQNREVQGFKNEIIARQTAHS